LEQMGKYQLVRRLATGGMAEVYLAKAAGPMGFEKELVVKRILPHLAEDPQFIEMFLTEAKLAARLNHGNVVQIFDFGEQEDAYFIAMEYVDGLNLKTLAKRAFQQGTPISYPLIARIISMACEGLAYAHELVDTESGQPMGFIHRDISTDNILVSMTGGVKVVDFGIAKAANVGQQTLGGVLKGKLAYMPPEYLRGIPIDSRADIYALGVVLYELIAGRKPFVAETEEQLAQLIVHAPAVDVRTLRADVPAQLVQVLEKALNKDRQARYASCRRMQADLERFLFQCGEPVGALQLAELVKALVAVAESSPRRNSREVPSVAPSASLPPTQVTRSLRPPQTSAAPQHVHEDKLVTPAPFTHTNTRLADEDEELLRLVSRPRWHWPVGIAAGMLLLGGVGVVSFSQEKDSSPPNAVAAIAESQNTLPSDARPAPALATPAAAPPPSTAKDSQEPKTDPQQAQARPEPTSALKPGTQDAGKATAPEDVDSASAPNASGTTRLKVSCNYTAQAWVNERALGNAPSKLWERAMSPGKKKIEVNGTADGYRFSKVQFFRLEKGQVGEVKITIQQVTVQVTGQPADMKVLTLDTHSLDSQGKIKTLEGWHTLKVIQLPSGKSIPAECEAQVGNPICKVVLSPPSSSR
jgi:serine/threonine protein kinase